MVNIFYKKSKNRFFSNRYPFRRKETKYEVNKDVFFKAVYNKYFISIKKTRKGIKRNFVIKNLKLFEGDNGQNLVIIRKRFDQV